MCERKNEGETPVCPTEESMTPQRTKYLCRVQDAQKEQTCQGKDKFNESDICLAPADTAAKCQSILMGNLGKHVKCTKRLIFREAVVPH